MSPRIFSILSLSLALISAVPALADEGSADAMSEAAAAAESTVSAMSEDEVAATVRADAIAADRALDAAVQAGQLSLTEAQPLYQADAIAQDGTHQKGFKSKL